MLKRKEIIINEVDLLKENKDLLKRVMAWMRVYLQRNGGHIRNKNILRFRIIIRSKDCIFYYFLLLDVY